MIKLSPVSWLAVGIVALLQTAALATMVYGRVTLLASGREIVAEVIPVDPRDLFRGDYVVLGYTFSRADVPVSDGVRRGDKIYVTLRETAPEKWEVIKASPAHEETTDAADVILKGIVDHVYDPPGDAPSKASISYGIESYYVPEGTGRELERMVRDKKISAVLAVGPSGDVAVKALMADGQRVAEDSSL